MRKFLCLPLLMCVLLTGCVYLLPQEEEILAPPLIEPEEIVYQTRTVGRGDIEQVLSVQANFQPTRYASVSFVGQGGRIADIPVSIGQMVEEGALLIELESESIRRQIRQQALTVEKAQLTYDALTLDTFTQEYDLVPLEQARIDLQMQKNSLELLEKKAEEALRDYWSNREDILLQRDQQRLTVQKAELALVRQEESYAQWQSEQELVRLTGQPPLKLEQARIDLQMQKNILADLKGDLERARLYAPFAGKLTYMMSGMEIGSTVGAYTTLFRVADLNELVLAYTGESAYSFTIGMQVSIQYKNETYPGEVVADPRSIPAVDGKAVNQVQFSVSGLTLEDVASGDGARVSVVLQSRNNVVVLPKNTINSFWGRKFVNVLEDGIKVERDVETGIETATEVEIVKGVSEGETIIVP